MFFNIYSYHLWLTLLISCVFTGCQPAPPSTAKQTETETVSTQTDTKPVKETNITILALGDSLTEGLGVADTENYPAQLEKALKQSGIHAKIVNSGLSGETSTGLVNRLDWALKTQPDITILTIGANDAMRGIAIKTIEANIRQSIERIQQSGSVVILSGMQIYDNMGDDYVQSFANMYQHIAKDMNVRFIPFFLEGVAADINLNQNDRIHPNAKGYAHIVEKNILPVLTPVVTEVLASQAKNK